MQLVPCQAAIIVDKCASSSGYEWMSRMADDEIEVVDVEDILRSSCDMGSRFV